MLDHLKSVWGIDPGEIKLYRDALRHKSAVVDKSGAFKNSNERLEYLGDAILDATVADYLFLRFPNKDEGFLTKMRSKIVSRAKLNSLAHQIGLDKLIESNLESGSVSHSINGNAFEALIGAIYLDKGYAVTRELVKQKVLGQYLNIESLQSAETDHKSRLIEWSQKEKKALKFKVTELDSTAAVHGYSATVFLEDKEVASGEGTTKKKAEQQAAKAAWQSLFNE